jgi:hypothetical protein
MWGSGGIAPAFLSSALDGVEWSASQSCCFTPRENAPGDHWVRGWVSLRVGLDNVEKRKVLHCRESIPASPAHSPSLYQLSYPDSSVSMVIMLKEIE